MLAQEPFVLITDLRHYLTPDLRIPSDLPGPVLRLARFQGAIVEWVTIWNLMAPVDTNVACRRRPGRRPCPGTVQAAAVEDATVVAWICPVCGDAGRITGWQGTPWDRFDEAFGDDGDEEIDDSDVPNRAN